jgi:hypothetical protein
MKVNQLKRWIFALTAPDSPGFAAATAGSTVVIASTALYVGIPILLAGAAVTLTCYALVVKAGLKQYDNLGATAIAAAASAWARDGSDADEVRRRQSSIMELGAGAALAAAGTGAIEYLVNIDGTPMVEGSIVDLNGNPFGIILDHDGVDLMTTDFSVDAANGMVLTPDIEYHSPMGMQQDSMGMSHDPFNHNS